MTVALQASDLDATSILAEEETIEALSRAAEILNEQARTANSEDTIRTAFAIRIAKLLEDHFGIVHTPELEVGVSTRLVTRGRIDSSYGALIVEFKQPSKLRTARQKQDAQDQLEDYLEALWKQDGNNYLGLLTDGIQAWFVRIEHGVFRRESYIPLSAAVLERVVRMIISLDQVALTSKNLVRDFCLPTTGSLYQRLAQVLHSSLTHSPAPKTEMLYGEWRELFRLAHDDSTKQAAIEERKQSLEAIFGGSAAGASDEYHMLYALQTTYALLVKLIALKVVRDVYFESPITTFRNLQELTCDELREALVDMEEGSTFRAAGVLNLLEGDFFSWYADPNQWTPQICALVLEALGLLAKYEDQLLTQDFNVTRDLFRDLYEEIIPGTVRHSLGEFYTPPWLADLFVQHSLEHLAGLNHPWRALDPCAGSGTFITRLIAQILEDTVGMSKDDQLSAVLNRVMAIDLNPLAVLTARVNYFVNIAPLIDASQELLIPVFLGDSSYVATDVALANVPCLEYQIQTLRGPLSMTIPRSALRDHVLFSQVMTRVEDDIKALREDLVLSSLESLVDSTELIPEVQLSLKELADSLVDLERQGWNGIWARIVTNFLSAASLPRFDLIIGNPPWIDWKNLPAGYRERIKGICVERHLFSGDRVTGGINLNICALIANVAADKWLDSAGILAFLMPENILFQQTYEGFRKFHLSGASSRLYLQELLDFTKAGHPFKPVQYPFHGYIFSANPVRYGVGINVSMLVKKKGKPSIDSINEKQAFVEVENCFEWQSRIAGTTSAQSTAFSYAEDRASLRRHRLVSGTCEYVGREGIEFYPQELLLLKLLPDKAPKGHVWVTNFQNINKRSKYKVRQQNILLETKFLHPLIKGVDIDAYSIDEWEFLVPFPYDVSVSTRLPISMVDLRNSSPKLAKYLESHRMLLEAQTGYNTNIIGKANHEFHALARVGAYSFHDVHIGYRDNTSWCAAVSRPILMPWGEYRRPLFQNHAASICERSDGTLINEVEAHYVTGIFNTKIVRDFIHHSSDSRTFKVRPNVYVPLFDPTNSLMNTIAREARNCSLPGVSPTALAKGLEKIEQAYIALTQLR